MKRQPDANVPM